MYQLTSKCVYAFLTFSVSRLAKILTRIEIVGIEHIPKSGPLILICNHSHNVDPPLVGSFFSRTIYTMAKSELFINPLSRWLFRSVNAFPVERLKADLQALRIARTILNQKKALLLFPEGTRNHGKGLNPALPGAALIALKTKSPILPIGISGTHLISWKSIWFLWLINRRPKLIIEFGEPFELPQMNKEQDIVEKSTDYMMRKVADLLSERYRGVYGEKTKNQIVVARATSRK
ncbi:MAG: 1-acyl-sn-glycerol-3-phosphate acyltransferase [Chloroflexi bacterium]|nr:1-acyl-sn-glycerol-3-phosphate acyltransferase [Chloroflexota bacterium]